MMKTVNEIKLAIGKAYVEGTFASENSEYVGKAFKEISRVNRQLFERIPFKVEFTSEDPYASAKEMRAEVLRTGVIKIFTEWSGHPFLTQEENNWGRAVHDIFAHLVCGCPFNFEGEYSAYLEQRKYYPEWTWRVLFAEIPGQTCAYYYKGDFSYDQRAIEAPQEWLDLCKGIEQDYSENAILDGILELQNS